MGIREEIQKRIDEKEAEISECEKKVLENRAYIQGLSDTLRLLQKAHVVAINPDLALRRGSAMAAARAAIKQAGVPLHIADLLKALNQPLTRATRSSLSSSLNSYARRNEIFMRTGPNTFGLIEMHAEIAPAKEPDEPPEFFGRMDVSEQG